MSGLSFGKEEGYKKKKEEEEIAIRDALQSQRSSGSLQAEKDFSVQASWLLAAV